MTIKLLSQAATEMIIAQPDKTDTILEKVKKLLSQRYPRLKWSEFVEKTADNIAKLKGITRIKITSAREIPEEEIMQIGSLIAPKTDITTKIDKNILGGVVIKTKDQQLDLSLRNKIDTLKQNLILGDKEIHG